MNQTDKFLVVYSEDGDVTYETQVAAEAAAKEMATVDGCKVAVLRVVAMVEASALVTVQRF